MAIATHGAPLTSALLKVLGLEGRQIRKLSLHMNVGECIYIDVTELVQDPEGAVGEFVESAGRYTIEPVTN